MLALKMERWKLVLVIVEGGPGIDQNWESLPLPLLNRSHKLQWLVNGKLPFPDLITQEMTTGEAGIIQNQHLVSEMSYIFVYISQTSG